MTVTLDRDVEAFIGSPRQLFINRQWCDAASGRTFETPNPATGGTLARVAEGGAEDIDRAVRAARRAFEDGPWGRMTPSERGRIIWRIGDLILEHAGVLSCPTCRKCRVRYRVPPDDAASRFPLRGPRGVVHAVRVRRYGFHGVSHRFVSEQTAALLGRPPGELRLVTAHLGNGCSATAVRDGVSVDTTMGLTPLDGLVMGTRSGDVDPGLLSYLAGRTGLGVDELTGALNADSGLEGLSGVAMTCACPTRSWSTATAPSTPGPTPGTWPTSPSRAPRRRGPSASSPGSR